MEAPAKEPKVGLLLGLGVKPKAGEEADEPGDGMDPKSMAGKALRMALKGDDDMAVYDAVEELVRLCDDDAGMGEEEEIETDEG